MERPKLGWGIWPILLAIGVTVVIGAFAKGKDSRPRSEQPGLVENLPAPATPRPESYRTLKLLDSGVGAPPKEVESLIRTKYANGIAAWAVFQASEGSDKVAPDATLPLDVPTVRAFASRGPEFPLLRVFSEDKLYVAVPDGYKSAPDTLTLRIGREEPLAELAELPKSEELIKSDEAKRSSTLEAIQMGIGGDIILQTRVPTNEKISVRLVSTPYSKAPVKETMPWGIDLSDQGLGQGAVQSTTLKLPYPNDSRLLALEVLYWEPYELKKTVTVQVEGLKRDPNGMDETLVLAKDQIEVAPRVMLTLSPQKGLRVGVEATELGDGSVQPGDINPREIEIDSKSLTVLKQAGGNSYRMKAAPFDLAFNIEGKAYKISRREKVVIPVTVRDVPRAGGMGRSMVINERLDQSRGS